MCLLTSQACFSPKLTGKVYLITNGRSKKEMSCFLSVSHLNTLTPEWYICVPQGILLIYVVVHICTTAMISPIYLKIDFNVQVMKLCHIIFLTVNRKDRNNEKGI